MAPHVHNNGGAPRAAIASATGTVNGGGDGTVAAPGTGGGAAGAAATNVTGGGAPAGDNGLHLGHKKHKKHKHGGADAADGAAAKVAGGGMAGCPMMAGATATAVGVTQLAAPPTGGATAPVNTPVNVKMPGAPGAAAAPTAGTATGAAPVAPTQAAAAKAVQLTPLAAQLIGSAAGGTEASPVAQQVFSELQRNGAKIETMDDAQFAAKYGDRTAGLFDPATNGIVVPSRVAQDPAKLRLILLHEGVHWLQDNVQGGAEGLGGPIGQALQGAGAVRQTQPGTKADSQHDEAQAYLVEALTANQLGIKDAGLGVDASGAALNYESILAKVAATPEYQ